MGFREGHFRILPGTRFNPMDASLEIPLFVERRTDLIRAIVPHAELTKQEMRGGAIVYSRPARPGEQDRKSV